MGHIRKSGRFSPSFPELEEAQCSSLVSTAVKADASSIPLQGWQASTDAVLAAQKSWMDSPSYADKKFSKDHNLPGDPSVYSPKLIAGFSLWFSYRGRTRNSKPAL